MVLPVLLLSTQDGLPRDAQGWPLTRAEASEYRATSTHADVLEFLQALQTKGAPIRVETIGTTTQGRLIPMAIASIPPVSTPIEAQRLGKPIVFIQANIHAGEVEGKEAALILLRRLSQAGSKGLLSKVTLLVVPNYNPDGNERFGSVRVNRPEQDGPEQVGTRANGQGLDLNRDSIKAASPEFRALLDRVYVPWDPDVMLDLHTTNGTRHGWSLTYATPNTPITEPSVLTFARDSMLPAIARTMQRRYREPIFDYGNAERRNNRLDWYTFGWEARYSTNYVGLRNRIGILSEATTYLPFRKRVEVTDRFVSTILEYTAANGRKIRDLVRAADARVVGWGLDPATAPQMGTRYAFSSRGLATVLLEKLAPRETVAAITQPPKQIEPTRMEVFDRFTSTRTTSFPAGYLLPPRLAEPTVALLRRHGIVVERLLAASTLPVQQFKLETANVARNPFQGQRLVRLDGTYQLTREEVPAGWFVVRTAQPLGILAFHLLDPESDDGVVAWGHLGTEFTPGQEFPIRRLPTPPTIATERLP